MMQSLVKREGSVWISSVLVKTNSSGLTVLFEPLATSQGKDPPSRLRGLPRADPLSEVS